MLARKDDGCHDNSSVYVAHKERRMGIGGAIPDASRRFKIVVTWEHQLPLQAGLQCPESLPPLQLTFSLWHGFSKHCSALVFCRSGLMVLYHIYMFLH